MKAIAAFVIKKIKLAGMAKLPLDVVATVIVVLMAFVVLLWFSVVCVIMVSSVVASVVTKMKFEKLMVRNTFKWQLDRLHKVLHYLFFRYNK